MTDQPTYAQIIRDALATKAARSSRKRTTVPKGVVWMSNLGHPCPFYLWAQWHWPGETFSEESIGNMDQSTALAEVLKRRLMDAGFLVNSCEEVVSQQIEGLEIRGRLDCRLAGNGFPSRGGVPAEIKCYRSINQLNRLEDFLAGAPWEYKVPAQILGYLAANQETRGLVVLMDKATGEIKPIGADLEQHGWMLQTAYAVAGLAGRALRNGTEAPTLPEIDPTFCEECDYRSHCPLIKRCGPTTKADRTVRLRSVDADMAAVAMIENEKAAQLYKVAKDRLKAVINSANLWPDGLKTGRVVVLTNTAVTLTASHKMSVVRAAQPEGEDQ